jgi:hypothetical protein
MPPHSGESLSMLGTLRGEGDTFKRDNALYVGTPVADQILLCDHDDVLLTDHLGNLLTDHNG